MMIIEKESNYDWRIQNSSEIMTQGINDRHEVEPETKESERNWQLNWTYLRSAIYFEKYSQNYSVFPIISLFPQQRTQIANFSKTLSWQSWRLEFTF